MTRWTALTHVNAITATSAAHRVGSLLPGAETIGVVSSAMNGSATKRARPCGGGAEAADPDRAADRRDEQRVAEVRVRDQHVADAAGGEGDEREHDERADALRAVGAPLRALQRERDSTARTISCACWWVTCASSSAEP